MKKLFTPLIASALLMLVPFSVVQAYVGQSSIITLVFPYGARSTGLGETSTGVADDASATFYNPAGLGQEPLASTWKHHNPESDSAENFVAVASRSKDGLGNKQRIWIASDKGTLKRFNGRIWEEYDALPIEPGEDLDDLIFRVLKTTDNDEIKRAERLIVKKNEIQGKKRDFIAATLKGHASDSLIEELSDEILKLADFDQNKISVYGKISLSVDSLSADSLATKLTNVFTMQDRKFSDLIDIRIPFSIAAISRVNDLFVDESDRLWIATPDGLWRYNGIEWKQYKQSYGLPSNNIIKITVSTMGEILVATDKGAALIGSDDNCRVISKAEGLPSDNVTAVAFGKDNEYFIGTDNGLAHITDSIVTLIDSSTGLVANSVTALLFSPERELWVGGKNGLSIYSGTSWKKYRFPGSTVSTFCAFRKNEIWIGTDKGAISYDPGKTTTDEKTGLPVQSTPKWQPYHSKNSLKGNSISSIAVYGKDIWIVTDEAINQHRFGDRQIQFFWEPLLPAFDLPDLWHAAASTVIPLEEFGTVGIMFNYLSFGENEKININGVVDDEKFRSFEFVAGISYGVNLRKDFSVGLNVKCAVSVLDPTIDGGTAAVFAIDAGLLKRNLLIKNLDIGLMFQNMGPDVAYTSKDDVDPIPFTIRLGLSYKPIETPIHSLMAAIDLEREIVHKAPGEEPSHFWTAIAKGLNDQPMEDELKEIIVHAGLEWWYIQFLALRVGLLFDEAGSRKELNLGIGLKYGKLGIDWSYINAPTLSEARTGQWRLSFTVKP